MTSNEIRNQFKSLNSMEAALRVETTAQIAELNQNFSVFFKLMLEQKNATGAVPVSEVKKAILAAR
jgi:hypothetical protein